MWWGTRVSLLRTIIRGRVTEKSFTPDQRLFIQTPKKGAVVISRKGHLSNSQVTARIPRTTVVIASFFSYIHTSLPPDINTDCQHRQRTAITRSLLDLKDKSNNKRRDPFRVPTRPAGRDATKYNSLDAPQSCAENGRTWSHTGSRP